MAVENGGDGRLEGYLSEMVIRGKDHHPRQQQLMADLERSVSRWPTVPKEVTEPAPPSTETRHDKRHSNDNRSSVRAGGIRQRGWNLCTESHDIGKN